MSDALKSLEDIASNSLYAAGVSGKMVKYSYQVFARYLRDGKTLEMGPAEGVMTELLLNDGRDLTVVEGAKVFCEDLKKRFPEVEVHHSLIEGFETDEKFDNIILGHVLEHVDDPVGVLCHVKKFLNGNGIILVAVPNAHSIHRQAAVDMGLLEKTNSLNELDVYHGHKRVYSIGELQNDFDVAGLTIVKIGGYWLKPVSNKQIETSWSEAMVDSFMRIGERYPEIAAEIYVVATDK